MLFWKNRRSKNALGQSDNSVSGENGGGETIIQPDIIIDTTYSSTSHNPQSGLAVGQAMQASNTNMSNKIGSVLRYKGSKTTYSQLPTSGNTIGDVWNVTDTEANYAYTGSGWDKLSDTLDALASKSSLEAVNTSFNAHKNNTDVNARHVTSALYNTFKSATTWTNSQLESLASSAFNSFITNNNIVKNTDATKTINDFKTSTQTEIVNSTNNQISGDFVSKNTFNSYKNELSGNFDKFISSDQANEIKVYLKSQQLPTTREPKVIYWLQEEGGKETVSGLELTIVTTSANEPVNLGYNLGKWDMPYSHSITVDGLLDWGDGSNVVQFKGTEGASTSSSLYHKYVKAGTYTIKIGGTISWNKSTDTTSPPSDSICNKLTKIALTSGVTSPIKAISNYGFYRCAKITSIPSGLLDNCTSTLDLSYCFGNTQITSIPNTLFDKCVKATTFNGIFSYTPITSIPDNLFDKCTSLTSLSWAFDSCLKLTKIPDRIFEKLTNCAGIAGCFKNCSFITAIPDNLFASFTKVVSFNECFQNCNKITKIPEHLFDTCPNGGSFNHCFENTSITSIPANLFAKSVITTQQYDYCFNGCSKVMGALPTLWSKSNVVYTHTNCYNGCYMATNYDDAVDAEYASWPTNSIVLLLENPGTSAIEIPLETYNSSSYSIQWGDGTTNTNTKTHTFGTSQNIYNVIITGTAKWRSSSSTSSNPTSLTNCLNRVIVTGKCPIRVWAQNGFQNATKLRIIRGGLFNNVVWSDDIGAAHIHYSSDNTKYWRFNGFFSGCTKLFSYPSTIFNTDTSSDVKGTIQGINFSNAFSGCDVSFVGNNLFKNLPALSWGSSQYDGEIQFLNTFANSKIAEIPSGFFDGLPSPVQLYSFGNTFSNCTSLKTIPTGLLGKLPTVSGSSYNVAPKQFTSMFGDCTGLKSIPSDILTGVPNDNKTDISYMFQQCTGITGALPTVWNTHGSTRRHEGFYSGCSNASNYGSVPSGWKQ